MFAKASAILVGIFFLGFTHSAIACSIAFSPEAFENRPKIENILDTYMAVFIGTVVDSGRPRYSSAKSTAKFKVEIPIRGEPGEIFEVTNGGGGACTTGYEVGQRWFFSPGSSTILVDEFGNVRHIGFISGPDPEEIYKMFPQALKLPAPSIVVQDYLKVE
jgi:hypothetical protein